MLLGYFFLPPLASRLQYHKAFELWPRIILSIKYCSTVGRANLTGRLEDARCVDMRWMTACQKFITKIE